MTEQFKLNVFVADDSMPSKMIMMIMLESLGCIVTGADDGEEALSIASKQEFDLIFLDEKMPGLLGSDVANLLREAGDINSQTPKVSLTGITDKGAINELYNKGITHYLEKPISKIVLVNYLKSIV
ncbi:hypothetical protein MUS1_06815 [Marinomonas ushuaiensis DSM 15871]|uniref:Response regulatory domain-containing protein n=1 Tax=Marinomonas ushuaiensis DSM 15871 TaxID=1122207 RepID=X7E0E5_9GAMM|nr:response regulator [Marinomonas ushuaiensis]ETX09539.1 hypothetical protein MUS1_06815 [Marinomonas ushuaiensis DSM 15871]